MTFIGRLHKLETGRWEIRKEDGESLELTSGDRIAIMLFVDKAPIPTRIEFFNGAYYSTNKAAPLQEGAIVEYDFDKPRFQP